MDKVETETDKDNLAIREIGLNHIKNAYKKINSESKVENPEETEKNIARILRKYKKRFAVVEDEVESDMDKAAQK